MIHFIKKIVEDEVKSGKSAGNKYVHVTFADENDSEVTYNIFDGEMRAKIQECYASGEAVVLTLEKKGNYTNIIGVAAAGSTLPQPKQKSTPELPPAAALKPPQAKSTGYSDKDRQIARAVAIKGVIELICSDKLTFDQMYPAANKLTGWLLE